VKPDWFWYVHIDSLELSCCRDCILGQLYGNYEIGKHALTMDEGTAEFFGFNLSTEEAGEWNSGLLYSELDDRWIQEIIKRREEVTGMDIGTEKPAIIVEPLETPEESPAPTPERKPEPVKIPAKEPALV
jgi:hypothetical protein